MSKRKRRVSKPKVEEEKIGGKDAPLPPKPIEPVLEVPKGDPFILKSDLREIVAELEANPVMSEIPQYALPHASLSYKRYQKLLGDLKKLVE